MMAAEQAGWSLNPSTGDFGRMLQVQTDSPADWSWYWELNVWTPPPATGKPPWSAWMMSMFGDASHRLDALNTNRSLLPHPDVTWRRASAFNGQQLLRGGQFQHYSAHSPKELMNAGRTPQQGGTTVTTLRTSTTKLRLPILNGGGISMLGTTPVKRGTAKPLAKTTSGTNAHRMGTFLRERNVDSIAEQRRSEDVCSAVMAGRWGRIEPIA